MEFSYETQEEFKERGSLGAVSVPGAGTNEIDSILSGVKWSSNTIAYSFPSSSSQYGSGYASDSEAYANFRQLNPAQQAAARRALSAWSNVCNLTFVETRAGLGDIRFGTSSKPATSWAYYPAENEGGDVWFGNTGRNAPTNPVEGTYAYSTYMHEIGHALGFKHPHDAGQSGIVGDYKNDAVEYSIMSYRSYNGSDMKGYTIADGSYPTTLMMNDIAAAQYTYGANFNYNSGDNVYKFDPNQKKIFETIWDGGGVDTYDLSAYRTDLKIDLRPGEWSTFSQSQLADLGNGHLADGNVANAMLYKGDTRSLIENAIGGSGNDTIIGNDADNILDGGAGNDTLFGGAGNDILRGGTGNDTYLFGVGCGHDTIDQYWGTNGRHGNDKIVFQNLSMDGFDFNRTANDLICTIKSTGETLDINNWFSGIGYQVEQLQFTNGTWTSDQINQQFRAARVS